MSQRNKRDNESWVMYFFRRCKEIGMHLQLDKITSGKNDGHWFVFTAKFQNGIVVYVLLHTRGNPIISKSRISFKEDPHYYKLLRELEAQIDIRNFTPDEEPPIKKFTLPFGKSLTRAGESILKELFKYFLGQIKKYGLEEKKQSTENEELQAIPQIIELVPKLVPFNKGLKDLYHEEKEKGNLMCFKYQHIEITYALVSNEEIEGNWGMNMGRFIFVAKDKCRFKWQQKIIAFHEYLETTGKTHQEARRGEIKLARELGVLSSYRKWISKVKFLMPQN